MCLEERDLNDKTKKTVKAVPDKKEVMEIKKNVLCKAGTYEYHSY